jgi:hypothetical protein
MQPAEGGEYVNIAQIRDAGLYSAHAEGEGGRVPRVIVPFVTVAGFASAITLWAGGYTASPPVQASRNSPFASCTADNVAAQPGAVNPDTEVEPWLAVNPTNPRNLAGGWQQDRWSNGGARGVVAGVSVDGGLTWTSVVVPGISKCSGGAFDRATDSWVSFSPNGTLYYNSLAFNALDNRNAVFVNRSTDGGFTWSAPVALIDDNSAMVFNDKNSITADPTDSRFVYAVWDRTRHPAEERPNASAGFSAAFRGDAMFTRTTDGGLTWEPPRAIFQPQKNLFTLGNVVAVLPDGTLLDVFQLSQGALTNLPGRSVAVMRSTDRGETWSSPQVVSALLSAGITDPETSQDVRASNDLPEIAVAPVVGTAYVVWGDRRFSGNDRIDSIVMSKSVDGGLTWSTPVAISQTPSTVAAVDRQAFTPSIAVAADGTIGVSYYDFRSNTSDPNTLLTDRWFVHSHDGGATWSENHLAGPFDLSEAPVARGLFLGDYHGLVAVGFGFNALYGVSSASDRANMFSSRIGP